MEEQTGGRRRISWQRACLPAIATVAIIVIVVGMMFPVFSRARAKARQAFVIGELSSGGPAMGEPGMAPVPAGLEMAGEAEEAGGEFLGEPDFLSMPFGSAAYAAEITRQIIYRANFTIEVQDVDATAASIETTVKAAGGSVSDKKVQEYTAGERTCTIIVRVPAGKFDEVCEAFRKSGEVLSEGIETDDVTEEFVDLEARLSNLKREEGILVELFDRRGKIADVLQVERELSRVRGEIERLEGRLKYLKDRVNYSTITATLRTQPTEVVGEMHKWDLTYHVLRAWRALVNVARALTYVVIYTVIVAGPFVVVALVIWGIVRAVRWRRLAEYGRPPWEDQEQ